MSHHKSVVTLLHPGEMGAAVGRQARAAGSRVLWVTAGRSPATRERAEQAGLDPRAVLAEALAESTAVLSVCPPAAAEEVAREVAACGFAGLYVEANAIAPHRAARIAERIAAAGARTVDGGIIGPPPQRQGTTRLYLSGTVADVAAAAALFDGSVVEAVAVAGPVGRASALKLAYASYQKVSRVLAAVAHALARDHEVSDHLRREADLLRSRPLADTDELPRVAARAWRWAPEMVEAAETLERAGLPADLAAAAATVLRRWEPARDRTDLALDPILDGLHDQDRPSPGTAPGGAGNGAARPRCPGSRGGDRIGRRWPGGRAGA